MSVRFLDRIENVFFAKTKIGKALRTSALALGAAAFLIVAFARLSAESQLIVGVIGVIVFFILNRRDDETATLYLKILSLLVSMRYLVWRLIDTLDFHTTFQAVLGVTLAVSEIYAFMMLVLIYFQVVHPLERRPAPLPDDPADWPTIDVYIPTYNEELSIVRALLEIHG